MHQAIPAAPIPPGNCGAFVRIVGPGGRALAYSRTTPGFLTHTWFVTRNTNMENFIGKDFSSFVGPHPRVFSIQNQKKRANTRERGEGGGGGAWAQLQLTAA